MKFVAIFFFFSLKALAFDASDPAWRALLHYQGDRSSVASDSSFFLSPAGYKDPAAELAATLEYFARDPEAPCRYPARAIYLHHPSPGTAEGWCERWRKWREALNPRGVELVYASAFVNSPSSMYGHTLLKFSRAGKTEELLDYTLSYGAETGNTGGLAYVLYGLSGGFQGKYGTSPFYLKVKEYNFVENRDFWIYPLKLRPEELEILTAHAWELRDVSFPYYFLRKNCSFYLLEFLEVARPGTNLTKPFPFWTIPMDTIRHLQDLGWLNAPTQRHSRAKQLEAQWNHLDSEERTLARARAEGDQSSPLPEGRERQVLDAAYDLWRYRTESKPADIAREKQLLQERSHFPGAVMNKPPAELPPHLGHLSARIGFTGGMNRDHGFGELDLRFALHDLLGNPQGYEKMSELSMGDLRTRTEHGTFYLERLDLLRILAVSPRAPWFPKLAWSFRLGLDRAKEMDCFGWRCLKGMLNGGGGLSFQLGPVTAFGLGEVDFEQGGVFDPNYRIAIGPTAGIFVPAWKGGRVLAEAEARFRVMGEHRQRRPLRLSFNQDLARNWEVRAGGEKNRAYKEASFGFFHYF